MPNKEAMLVRLNEISALSMTESPEMDALLDEINEILPFFQQTKISKPPSAGMLIPKKKYETLGIKKKADTSVWDSITNALQIKISFIEKYKP
ncbi:Uncharacterised protein [Yersinia pseudotuberculosis]|uniref:hypothetical protein n=1 Tax=Yersinia pseudotuberculosis TaxID=633 RepID=UPI0001739748|nr:hypothetical protein [Yersinia pseudotuberculosis]AJJ66558.1 hypothetical protein BZ16_1200 [Yersinia pseudotuberculosis PB1/+]MBO1556326.1 hypothetical protein [Yersinia pseudotuberculosis]CNK40803.1 Uncharacterised protein [Yersinia pseudotuberculosis]CNK70241.1 Uncharacterised protein [Yersinia pseudotuberculosis]